MVAAVVVGVPEEMLLMTGGVDVESVVNVWSLEVEVLPPASVETTA